MKLGAVRLEGSSRDDSVAVILSTWLIVGLFLDGFAHENLLDAEESFFTVWHAVFYSGFLATASWIWRLVSSGRAPSGYGSAVVGIVVFGVGGAGDVVWHMAWGVETGVDALLSPTHLVLFAGLVLILMAPILASVARSTGPTGPSLVAAGLILALTAFFVNFAWGLGSYELLATPYDPISSAGEVEVIAGIASSVVTTTVLFGGAVFISRWLRPRGATFSIMFTTVAVVVTLGFEEGWHGPPAALVGGAILDLAVWRWNRIAAGVAGRGRALIGALALAATATWVVYYGIVVMTEIVEWPHEIWTGAVVLNAFVAAGIGLLAEGSLRVPSSA